jgi:hypothetical protein
METAYENKYAESKAPKSVAAFLSPGKEYKTNLLILRAIISESRIFSWQLQGHMESYLTIQLALQLYTSSEFIYVPRFRLQTSVPWIDPIPFSLKMFCVPHFPLISPSLI